MVRAVHLDLRRASPSSRSRRGSPPARRRPGRRCPCPVASPWRMKLRGRPSAMPEPPVRSGASAQASPIASRSSSAIASTMTSRSPRAAARVERLAERRRARRTTAHGTRPTGSRDWRASQRRRSGSVIGLSGWFSRPGFVEQPVADEEMALVDGAAGGREGRAGDDAVDAERLRQRLADRADIALGRRIEGRAVFEHELPAALRPQPLERLERERDRVGGRDRAALQRDDAGLAGLRRAASSARRGTARSRARPWRACWRCRSRR